MIIWKQHHIESRRSKLQHHFNKEILATYTVLPMKEILVTCVVPLTDRENLKMLETRNLLFSLQKNSQYNHKDVTLIAMVAHTNHQVVRT